MSERNENSAQDDVAALARKFWEDEGHPEGRAEEHWRMAEERIRHAQPPIPPKSESTTTTTTTTAAGSTKDPLTAPPPNFPERSILVRRTDGLGARLLAFLRAWRFARKLGAGIRLVWLSLDHRGREERLGDEGLDALLDLKAMREAGRLDDFILVDRKAVPKDNGCLEKMPIHPPGLRAGFTVQDVFASGPLIECQAQRAYRIVGESAAAVHDEMVAIFESLIFHPAIEALREEFRTSIVGRPFAVVHVRRGDVLVDMIAYVKNKWQTLDATEEPTARSRVETFIVRCTPTWALMAETERLGQGLPILVMGDSRERIAELRGMVGEGRLVGFPAGRATVRSVQRAFLDLILIREAAVVVGGRSAFTTLPAEVGNGRLSIVLPNVNPEKWLATFEEEVLDPAGVPESGRAAWRTIYLERWHHYANHRPNVPRPKPAAG